MLTALISDGSEKRRTPCWICFHSKARQVSTDLREFCHLLNAVITAQRVEQERSALSLHSATQLQRLADEKTSLQTQFDEVSAALKLAEHEVGMRLHQVSHLCLLTSFQGAIHRARIIEVEEKLEEAIETERLLQQQYSTQQTRIDDDAACIGRLQQERFEIEKTSA